MTTDQLKSAQGMLLTTKGGETRRRIVETAAELMHARGVSATRMQDVRDLAGISGSQLSHYFGDKQALIRAVIAYQADYVIAFHTEPPLERLDSFRALAAWAELNIDAQLASDCRLGCRFGSLVGELTDSDESTRAVLAAGYEQWREILREGIASMQARGVLRAEANPDQLANALIAAHQGGSLMSRTVQEITPLRDALDGALDYVQSFAVPGATRPALKTRRRRK
jgi:TetR/AcrR family transcriptional regulator, transcriptional repressor for nem operon